MENNKYYTPDIEEFHIGFEYEELCREKWTKLIAPPADRPLEWTKFKFNTSVSISKLTKGIKDNKIRVLFLSKEDIESLGWIQHSQYMHIWYIEASRAIFYLSLWKDGRYEIDNDRDGEKCFLGNIKNKSELKRLMKQLDIKIN